MGPAIEARRRRRSNASSPDIGGIALSMAIPKGAGKKRNLRYMGLQPGRTQIVVLAVMDGADDAGGV
jgi:hypothetical protein